MALLLFALSRIVPGNNVFELMRQAYLYSTTVTTATCIVAVGRGNNASTTSEVVSKISFEILFGRIGVVRTVSGVMA
jgi:hypothetical protein